jgi:hypothetical protein
MPAVAERLDRGPGGIERGDIGGNPEQVDDGLGGNTRDRGRADMMDFERHRRRCSRHANGLGIGLFRPARIVRQQPDGEGRRHAASSPKIMAASRRRR